MNTHRTDLVTPNTSTDNARNRPAGLPRRQRVASAIVSAVVSGVLLGSVVFGMVDSVDGPQVMAGQAAGATRA